MSRVNILSVSYSDEFKPTLRAFRAAVKKRDKSVSEVVRKLIEVYMMHARTEAEEKKSRK